MSNVQILEREPQLPRVLTPSDMLDRAIMQGADIAVLEKLMALHERWEANQARKAFDEAMAAAKAEIPVIMKNREVDFTSPKGRTHYRHEDLAEIARTVAPILGRHGLSYRFRATSNPNEPVVVTCIVSHRDGHAEEITLSAGRDDTGNKNSIQQVGSTLTYLQRMTLKAALGLAASDDDDAQSAAGGNDFIDSDEVENINTMLASTGADKDRFLKFIGAQSVQTIRSKDYARAVDQLQRKAQQKARANG